MKKGVIIILMLMSFLIPLLSAIECNLEISMINQDPYPAIPGDYVKVVFQIDGKYSSFYLATYKLRVDENALEGDNPIEVTYTRGDTEYIEEFNIYLENTKADFEVYVKDYDYTTKEITFEILNIEDSDIEALTIEIPKQENIDIKGPNKKVVGDLDSNEYTSADFEAIISEGKSEITLDIFYTDSINVRRNITKKVVFDSSYFQGRNSGKTSIPWGWVILILIIIGYFIWKRVKKHKEKKKKLNQKH
ncbi:MAG: hypothetical protein P8X70_03090 [Nanoarchaeota archaeon]